MFSRVPRGVCLALVALAMSACSGQPTPVTVLAASSLVDVVPALAAVAGVDVAVSDAGSQVLQAQVEAGATGNLLLLADPDRAQSLAQAGLASEPTVVARNGLAIVLGPDIDIDGPADLPGHRLVLANDDVPLGKATRRALAATPEVAADEVLASAVSLEDSARLVLAKVALGEADAAIVYVTDALASGLGFIAWPAGSDASVEYTLQVLTPTEATTRLADVIAGDAGRGVWQQFGFQIVTPS